MAKFDQMLISNCVDDAVTDQDQHDQQQLPAVLLYLTTNSCVIVQCYTGETNLRSNLSAGYNTFVRPSTPTLVYFYYNLRSLQELNIAEQKMTLTGWLTAYWEDSRFQWNSTQYDKIEDIEINWGWRPEFVISNSANSIAIAGMDDDDTRLRVYENGKVRWNQMLNTVTTCEVDITNFPFDTQSCDLEFIFWSYTDDEVQLLTNMSTIESRVYLENAEWIFSNSSVSFAHVTMCCPYSDAPLITYSLTFIRRRPFYMINFISPTILLAVCMVWVFLLPTESGERLGFALTVLLAYTVQLSIIAQLMPTTSKQTPHIAVYLLTILILCAVVTCNVVINVKLFYKTEPVYGWLQVVYRKLNPVIFLTCFANIRCKKKAVTSQVDDLNNTPNHTNKAIEKQPWPAESESEDEPVVEKPDEVTWDMVSVLADRICFYSYFIVVAIINGIFLNTISK